MALRIGGERLVIWMLKRRGHNVEHLTSANISDRFSTIYEKKVWAEKPSIESMSGPGSTLQATQQLRSQLPLAIERLKIDTLLDLGCGDFHWMRELALPLSKYIGADIVPDVVERNRADYGRAGVEFVVKNGCEDPLPKVDAILCRETMFHLSFKDGLKLIKNVKQSGAKYFLCTNDPAVRVNADIPTGHFRDINLQLDPYFFGEPIETLADGDGPRSTRLLGAWKLH